MAGTKKQLKENGVDIEPIISVINDLTTGGTDVPGSAEQLKVLDQKKTDREISGTSGKAMMFNEADGGGAKFEHTDGTKSFVGVNDGGASGITAQIYAVDGTNKGTRINVKKDKIYYTKDKTTPEVSDADEIATKGDIPTTIAGSFKGRVATKADLPTTGVVKGDWAIVLKDETHDNTSTYYEYVTAWEYRFNVADNYVMLLGNEEGSGQPYHIPFNINPIVQEASQISTTFDTITLDNNKTKKSYPIVIPSANPTADKAGLLTKALYDAKLNKLGSPAPGIITYHIPYDVSQVAEKDYIQLKLNTVTLDNNETQIEFAEPRHRIPLAILTATTEKPDGQAGLYNKTIHDGIYADINKKVTAEITSGIGKARIFNEVDGGGAKYEFTGGQKSFVGVNNDLTDVMAQIYALDNTNKGTRINVKQSAIYYTKNKDNPTVTDNDEIATKGDVATKVYIKKSDGHYKSEIGNNGTVITNLITYDNKDRSIIQQESAQAFAYITDGASAKSKLIINTETAYLQKGTEVGVAIQPGQELVRKDALDLKVDRSVKDDHDATSTFDNSKGQEGCVMQTLLSDGKTLVSFNTNSADGADGILGQIYAKNTETNEGMRFNIYKDGIYYGKGTSSPTKDTDHEIATKGDIASMSVGIFRGNFDTKAHLDAYAGDKNKNDYAVVTADETKQGKTTRYVYSGSAWAFEYVIENNDCIKLLGTEAVSGLPYNLTYYTYMVPDASQIKVIAKTIPLDNSFGPDGKKVVTDYDMIVPSATQALAGLMSAIDKVKLDGMYPLSKVDVALTEDTTTPLNWGGTIKSFATLDEAKAYFNDIRDGKIIVKSSFTDSVSGSAYTVSTHEVSDWKLGTDDYLYGRAYSNLHRGTSNKVYPLDIQIGYIEESATVSSVIMQVIMDATNVLNFIDKKIDKSVMEDDTWEGGIEVASATELTNLFNGIKNGAYVVGITIEDTDSGSSNHFNFYSFTTFTSGSSNVVYADAIGRIFGTADLTQTARYRAIIMMDTKGSTPQLIVKVKKLSDKFDVISATYETHDTATEWKGSVYYNTVKEETEKVWQRIINGETFVNIFIQETLATGQEYYLNLPRMNIAYSSTTMYDVLAQTILTVRKPGSTSADDTVQFRVDMKMIDDTASSGNFVITFFVKQLESVNPVDIELVATAPVPYPVALLDQAVVDNIFATMPPLKVKITDIEGKVYNATMESYIKDNSKEYITANLKMIDSIGTEEQGYAFTTDTYALGILKTPKSTSIGNVNAVLEKIDAIVDDVSSDSSIRPLSARMGKYLNGRIDELLTVGRCLGYWNDLTGKAHNPVVQSGFSYWEGDYFQIETIASPSPELMPYGDTYSDVASTKQYEGTEEIQTGMFWVFKKGEWELQAFHQYLVSFGNIAGNVVDSPQIMNKFNEKVDKDNTVSATVTTSWTASGDIFSQGITVSGMKATDHPIVAFINTGTTKSEATTQQTEASKIFKIQSDNGKIILYATEATTTSLSILIKKV